MMDRFRSMRRVQIQTPPPPPPPPLEEDSPKPENAEEQGPSPPGPNDDEVVKKVHSSPRVTEDLEPFMGIKVRRRASLHRECKGDYLGVSAHPYLLKILSKQGDTRVLFADKVLKFTGSGKMKRRVLLITDVAIYLIDPEIDLLKRRIPLSSVYKICLSEFSDNFFAIIIPTEYDCLMASTRKTEIVTVLVEATKGDSEEVEVVFANKFDYNASAGQEKKIEFEVGEGGVKTRITRKSRD